MKRIVYVVLIIIWAPFIGAAQITIPVIKANFGVDADARANYFNGGVSAGNDDWFNNGTAGIGQFIIDTSGAAAIVAAYTTNPASRMYSFSKLMKQAPYSVVNNRLLLDGIFSRDYHGDDSTVFASGSNKNGMSPVSWSCPVSQGIPDKNDILDVFVHARRAGPNIMDSLWMFGGLSLENTTGNRYFDFELYQTDFYYDRATRTFQNYGPEAGHTAWLFYADGSVQRPGDIIFTAEYSSSSLTLVEARIWVNQSSLLMTPMYFNWGGLFDGASAGATYGYASILPKTAGTFYTGLQSANGVWPGPFSLVRQDNSVVTSYTARQYMEFSVNLTKLGLDPAYISSNGCATPFRRVLIKSRASTSFTAELKDFVAPFKMFDYPMPAVTADMPFFCGQLGISHLWVTNPSSTSSYVWSTTNGHIFGPTIGPNVIADTSGTYKVTQFLHAQCPALGADSLTIIYDPNCIVLETNLTSFTGVLDRDNVALNWKVSHEELMRSYAVEYSINQIDFTQLGEIPASGSHGSHMYVYNHNIAGINSPLVYYRVRLTGVDGRIGYSNIVAIRLVNPLKPGLIIYPNPSTSHVWASLVTGAGSEAEYSITDMSNRLISRRKISLYPGTNTISLSEMDITPSGTYILRLMAEGGVYTQKIIISR